MVSVRTTRIKYRGTFDFGKLYKTAFEWLKSEHFDVMEDTYKHKPPNEVELKFHGIKKVTGYILYRIDVRYYAQEFKPIEAVKDGKKKEMVQGRVFIDTKLTVTTDYEGQWTDTHLKERLKIFLEKFILKHKLDAEYVDPLYYKVLELNEKLKAVLEMDSHQGLTHKRPASYDDKEENYGE